MVPFLTRSTLLRMLDEESESDDSKISIYLALPASADWARIGQVTLKSLLQSVEKLVEHRAGRLPDAKVVATKLLPALGHLGAEASILWSERPESLVLFCSIRRCEAYQLPIRVRSSVHVLRRLYIRPITEMMTGSDRYLLLDLNLERPRLIRVEPAASNEMTVQGLIGLRDYQAELTPITSRENQTEHHRRAERHVQRRGAATLGAANRGATTIPGVSHSTSHDSANEERNEYLRRVAKQVDGAIAGEHVPLLVSGVPSIVKSFLPHLRYVNVLLGPKQSAIPHSSPYDLEGSKLWGECRSIELSSLRQKTTLDGFIEDKESVRLPFASASPGVWLELFERARNGKVRMLALRPEPSLSERAASSTYDPDLTESDEQSMLNEILIETLRHRGRIVPDLSEEPPARNPALSSDAIWAAFRR